MINVRVHLQTGVNVVREVSANLTHKLNANRWHECKLTLWYSQKYSVYITNILYNLAGVIVGLTMSGLKLSPPLTPGVKIPDRETLSGNPEPVGR